jgi:hypothetical protein
VLAAIRENLLAPARAGDQAIIYFAGRGAVARETEDAPPRLYLATAGADPSALAETATSFESLRDLLKEHPDKEAFVILDAAFEGGPENRFLTPAATSPPRRDEVAAALRLPGENQVVWLAAAPGTPLLEIEGLSHGLFTSSLLLGLGGAAAPMNVGRSSLNTLSQFVAEMVRRRSRELASKEQTPFIIPSRQLPSGLRLGWPSGVAGGPAQTASR